MTEEEWKNLSWKITEKLDNTAEYEIWLIIQEYVDRCQQENQELKKQLENCYCNRTDCSARIKDSKKYDSLVQRIENQQKEFIEWLESKIDTIIQQKETFAELEAGQAVSLMTLAIALEKYKEIIGGKDE